MTDDCWELTVTADAVRLLHRSVSFYYEKWPGGPDPEEQENLRDLKSILSAMMLETLYDQPS